MGLEYIAAGYRIGGAELYASYKSNGKGNKLPEEFREKQDLAVVIVDMQQDFLKIISPEKRDRIIRNQIRVIRYCSANEIPIVVLEISKYSDTIAELQEHLVLPLRTRKFQKKVDNGFTNPEIKGYLKGLNIKSLFFMGINADACVMRTAEGGLHSGYDVATAEEVIAQPEYWGTYLYRKLFGEKGRLYLDARSYLEKGREVRIDVANGDLIDRLVKATLF